MPMIWFPRPSAFSWFFAPGLALLAIAHALARPDQPASHDRPDRDSPGAHARAAEPAPKTAASARARPKVSPPGRDDAPRVISKTKAKEQGKGSEFLRPPGTRRYDPDAIDWRDVPPWRQASFFGIRARGQFFVYVVDCSGSMIDEERLTRAKAELRQSVARLREPQRFLVVFYNDQAIPMPGGHPRPANLASRNQLLAWLHLIEPDGETNPRGAISLALALRPDAVFLLSDGAFPEDTVAAVARANTRHVPIHCVDLSGGAAGDQLQRIAHDSGGHYAPRPAPGP